jgi:hypothetical protein
MNGEWRMANSEFRTARGNGARLFSSFAIRHSTFCINLAIAALIVAGCAAPRRSFQPEQNVSALSDVLFLHYLATVPVVTVDEGFRAVLMLVDAPGDVSTFPARRAVLADMGAIKAAWELEPEQVLDKGTLAHMVRTVSGLAPGLNELWLSPLGVGDRRYALKTCVYAGVMSPGLSYAPVTGGELLSVITKAESHPASSRPNGA